MKAGVKGGLGKNRRENVALLHYHRWDRTCSFPKKCNPDTVCVQELVPRHRTTGLVDVSTSIYEGFDIQFISIDSNEYPRLIIQFISNKRALSMNKAFQTGGKAAKRYPVPHRPIGCRIGRTIAWNLFEDKNMGA